MLQTTVAVIIVSPIATVFILAWYPARRLTFVWEFVLIFVRFFFFLFNAFRLFL